MAYSNIHDRWNDFVFVGHKADVTLHRIIWGILGGRTAKSGSHIGLRFVLALDRQDSWSRILVERIRAWFSGKALKNLRTDCETSQQTLCETNVRKGVWRLCVGPWCSNNRGLDFPVRSKTPSDSFEQNMR
jgi:hypothetical protein